MSGDKYACVARNRVGHGRNVTVARGMREVNSDEPMANSERETGVCVLVVASDRNHVVRIVGEPDECP